MGGIYNPDFKQLQSSMHFLMETIVVFNYLINI